MNTPRYFNTRIAVALLLIACLGACSTTRNKIKYVPDNKELYNTILRMDSIFFSAYNNCSTELDKYAEFYEENIEFYHDIGGLATSKKEIVESTKKYICGKVTRQLVPGSVEVYPVKNYGAIEVGYHTFTNHEEKVVEPSRPGRFVVVWHQVGNSWKIARVISLH